MEGSASMAKVYNPKLKNVSAAFENIQRHGHLRTYSGTTPGDEPGLPSLMATHVQGIAQNDDYIFLSHNRLGLMPTGMVAVIAKDKDEVLYWFDTPEQQHNYPHPGGIQIIGDYLVVPVETSDHDRSWIHFYDLTTMTRTKKPRKLAYSLHRETGSGAVGITNFTSAGTEYYLLAAYDNGALYFYQSNGKKLSEDGIAFSPLFDTRVRQEGYSSVCLLTDKNNGLHMIGFRTDDSNTAPEDRMDLYTINIDKHSLSHEVASRHMVTEHGGIVGPDGVHFRWGAGLRIASDDKLKAYATQRNFVFGTFCTNGFPPK